MRSVKEIIARMLMAADQGASMQSIYSSATSAAFQQKVVDSMRIWQSEAETLRWVLSLGQYALTNAQQTGAVALRSEEEVRFHLERARERVTEMGRRIAAQGIRRTWVLAEQHWMCQGEYDALAWVLSSGEYTPTYARQTVEDFRARGFRQGMRLLRE